MATYSIYMQAAISIEVEADTPEDAALLARARVLVCLTKLPPDYTSIGFEPEFEWQAREVVDDRGRCGPIVARGLDRDLRED